MSHSNVAALFDAHDEVPKEGIVRLYYEGLGREFSFHDRYIKTEIEGYDRIHRVEVEGYDEKDKTINGLAYGLGIRQRLEKAVFDLFRTIDDWRLARRVDEINVAAFGFSRGATEARAFMHWLAAHSKVTQSGTRLSYNGVPLNVKFLGLFDTVESVGAPGVNNSPHLIKTRVPAFVEKCTHLVAAHELRAAFPLTEVNDRRRCVVYPGAHADIGGGYADGEQDRYNWLARIALLQMLDEARSAGLKMRSIDEMKASSVWLKSFKPSFDVPQSAIDALEEIHHRSYGQAAPCANTFRPTWNITGRGSIPGWRSRTRARTSRLRARRTTASALTTRLFNVTFLNSLARTRSGRGGPRDESAPRVHHLVEHLLENYVHDSFEHFSMSGGTWMKDSARQTISSCARSISRWGKPSFVSSSARAPV